MLKMLRTVKYYAENLYNLDGYYMQKRRQKHRPLIDKSAEIRRYMVKDYIIPLWGHIFPSKLNIREIDKALVNLKSIRNGKPLSGITKNTLLTIMDDVFNEAIEDGTAKFNPISAVMKFSRTLTHPRNAIPKDELDLLFPPDHDDLLRVWGKQIYAAAYLILRDTGLRPGELRALKWQDWYSGLNFFPITKAIESGKQDKIKSTKTGSVKPAVVTDRTAQEIELLRNSTKNYSADNFIFADKRGPFTIFKLVYNFRQGVKRAGLDHPEYSPYWLRHTFNTRMLEILPAETVRLLMGHATEAMTRHYRHPDLESLMREAAKLKETLAQYR